MWHPAGEAASATAQQGERGKDPPHPRGGEQEPNSLKINRHRSSTRAQQSLSNTEGRHSPMKGHGTAGDGSSVPSHAQPSRRDTMQRGVMMHTPPCVCLSVRRCRRRQRGAADGNSILAASLAAGAGEKNPTVRRREGVYPSPPRRMRGGFIMDFPFPRALFGSSLSCQLEPTSSSGTLHHSQTLAGVTDKTQVKCPPGPPEGHI